MGAHDGLREVSARGALEEKADGTRLLGGVDEVFPVELEDVQRAKTVLFGRKSLSSRDALHVAVMERQGIRHVLSFDTGFDGVPGLTRLGR